MSCFSCFFSKNKTPKKINKDCPVCLENLVDILATENLIAFSCGHVICLKCVKNLEKISINIAYTKTKCPVCRNFSFYTHLRTDCNTKCIRCLKNLLELAYANKLLVHLRCGHCYCFNCAAGLLYKPLTEFYKCLICKNYYKVYPLYFVK